MAKYNNRGGSFGGGGASGSWNLENKSEIEKSNRRNIDDRSILIGIPEIIVKSPRKKKTDYYIHSYQDLVSARLPVTLQNKIAPAPPGMRGPQHIHHILNVNGQRGEERALIREGQDILRSYKIDPIFGIENLVRAPNVGRNHNIENTRTLVKELREIKMKGLSRRYVITVLKRYGNEAQRR